jgi:uncharacterized cupredoxin-like copper-binding protein
VRHHAEPLPVDLNQCRLRECGRSFSIGRRDALDRGRSPATEIVMLSSPRFSALLVGLLLFAMPAFAASQQVVNAELWNKPDGTQGITLSTDHVKPGKVLFKVKNISTDMDHELLLVMADSPKALPLEADGNRVDEDKLKGLKELGDVHPGKTRSTTVSLKAGKYVLFCNEAGHFKAGMVTPFTVSQ